MAQRKEPTPVKSPATTRTPAVKENRDDFPQLTVTMRLKGQLYVLMKEGRDASGLAFA